MLKAFETRYSTLPNGEKISEVKVLDTPKKIQEQMAEIFKIIFDHQERIKDTKIGEKLGISYPELRKLLGVLVKDGLIKQFKPNCYAAIITSAAAEVDPESATRVHGSGGSL